MFLYFCPQNQNLKKIAIIRFSSIGDIIQCLTVISGVKKQFPNAEIHFITRKDMVQISQIHPLIDTIHAFDRNTGLKGLIIFAKQLKKEQFDFIYDAHNNLRSHILKLILCPFSICNFPNKNHWITRKKHRIKRFLLFKFGINYFPKPFKAAVSFQKPLQKKGISNFSNSTINWQFPKETESRIGELLVDLAAKNWIAIAPSAAWELKRWNVDYWQDLVRLMPQTYFVVLGGKEDTFCETIKSVAPERVINLAGKTSLLESLCVVKHTPLVISGDTGILHAADLFEKKGIALIGPTAFGFPSNQQIKILEVELPCRPCTKDGSTTCKIKETKKCLRAITPEQVAQHAFDLMKS